MAFIATYISTSSASEMSSYFEEIAEWATTADVTAHELALQESYDYVNSKLDSYMSVPIAKEPTTGRYHALVRFAQAMRAIYLLLGRKHGWVSTQAKAALEAYQAAEKEMIEGRSQFELQTSPDELGINQAVANAANTSTARFIADTGIDFTGDHEQTYTLTITTGGAIATAVFSWADGEGNTTTGITTSYEWISLENNLRVRCIGTTFVVTDKWTIRCVPMDELTTTAAGGIINIELRK